MKNVKNFTVAIALISTTLADAAIISEETKKLDHVEQNPIKGMLIELPYSTIASGATGMR